MEIKSFGVLSRGEKALATIALALAMNFGFADEAFAASSEEAAIKLVQRSSYNILTGNWDVSLERDAKEIAEEFKSELPALDYYLVEEDVVMKNGSDRVVLTFRGEGDQRVVVKLKEMGSETNVRLRVGLAGSEAKSAELFKYVYVRM